MKLLGKYRNNNTDVTIFSDGTRICETEDDEFDFAFPLNIDVSITTKCDGGCRFCYMDCNMNGVHADLNQPWVDTIHPYTEVAINGNDLSHPGLSEFLTKLRDRNVIVNMTVNQKHFMQHINLLHILVDNDLIKGLGVSLVNPTDEFIAQVKRFPNAIIHVINGVVTPTDIEELSGHGLKLLILGYKQIGRGEDWYNEDHENIVVKKLWLNDNIENMLNKFKVVSFDNLALKQLPVVKTLLSQEEWEEFYAGDDGTCSMFVDMVNKTFARSSTTHLATSRPIMDNLDDMFAIVKAYTKKENNSKEDDA